MLVIRWQYAGNRYATYDAIHGFKTVSIREQFCIFKSTLSVMKISFIMNFHTQLIRFSHTQYCDRAINNRETAENFSIIM